MDTVEKIIKDINKSLKELRDHVDAQEKQIETMKELL